MAEKKEKKVVILDEKSYPTNELIAKMSKEGIPSLSPLECIFLISSIENKIDKLDKVLKNLVPHFEGIRVKEIEKYCEDKKLIEDGETPVFVSVLRGKKKEERFSIDEIEAILERHELTAEEVSEVSSILKSEIGEEKDPPVVAKIGKSLTEKSGIDYSLIKSMDLAALPDVLKREIHEIKLNTPIEMKKIYEEGRVPDEYKSYFSKTITTELSAASRAAEKVKI